MSVKVFLKDKYLFQLEVKTVGWVCLGLSPNGGVGGSDLIYGWVNSVGQATIVVSLSLS